MSYVGQIGQIDALIATGGAVAGMGIQAGTTAYLTGVQTRAQEKEAQIAAMTAEEMARIQTAGATDIARIQTPVELEKQKTIKMALIIGSATLILVALVMTLGTSAIAKKSNEARRKRK